MRNRSFASARSARTISTVRFVLISILLATSSVGLDDGDENQVVAAFRHSFGIATPIP
jgi:hypothetical protein